MKKFLIAISILIWLIPPIPLFALSEKGFEALDIFTKILHYVEKDYVESVDERRLIRGAIRGMLSTLDPHSVYLSPKIYKHLKADTSGIFGGVGLEITVRDGWVTVVSPVEGTPAAQAGIKPGDRILKINGKSTKGMDLGTAVKEMRGAKGKKVVLTIGRKGLKKPFDVSLTRQIIKAPSVQSELLEGKYPYVKVSSFQERTAEDLKKILKKYDEAILKQGLILDLRNNPGGLLNQAVQVCDLFLDNGVIVTTAARGKEIDRREATPDGGKEHYPMIILVNGGSASASEIVAGALQDQGRALILGTQSFGKGSVQSVIELEDGSALKLTIARYLTPKGRSIQAEGITPDVVIEPIPPQTEAKEGEHPPNIREKLLEGHLKGEKEEEGAVFEGFQEAPLDYQREMALNYLKSWDVLSAGLRTMDHGLGTKTKKEEKRKKKKEERKKIEEKEEE